MDALAVRLQSVVGPRHVLVDDDLTAAYSVDWTGRWRGRPRLVVRPSSTEQVAAVVFACAEAGAPMVPQGGNTGLVGGGVPRDGAGEVVVSLRRLDHMDPVDVSSGLLTAGAGATLAAAQRHARSVGLDLAVDFAARDSATLGGIVATNAGGERVLRYGGTRTQLRGLEAVLADGAIVSRLSGLPKDSAGYDLIATLVGSEGTLAIVTRVQFRLVPWLSERVVALVAVDGTAAAVDALGELRRRLLTLEAAELFYDDGLDLVCSSLGLARPFAAGHPAYLLVECADRSDPTEGLGAAVAGIDGVRDAALATDGLRREALWRYREAHAEAINAAGVPLKLDVALPLGALAAFDRDVRALVRRLAPAARLVSFGHLAEGNLHLNILGADDEDERLTGAVLEMVAAAGGSVGAEHGIGRAKTRWLHLSRSPAELAAMRAVKQALDPQWLLNPGVLFPKPEPIA